MNAEQRAKRAKVAAERRHHPDAPETEQLAAEFKAERLAEHIRRTVEAAPKLSPAQLAALAAVLGGAVTTK